MKLAAICDRDTAMGLRLAGIHNLYIPEDENPVKGLNTIVERDDIGIIFITEHLVQQMKRELHDFRLQHTIPIVVEIPDKTGRKKDQVDYVSYLVKRAVGIDVTKKEK